jgi:hypothetical protein
VDRLIFCLTLVVAPLCGPHRLAAESGGRVLATSLGGELRVEERHAEYWVVPSRDPADATRLPIESPDAVPVEFHFSPNAEWLFTLPNGGSAQRAGSLFHRQIRDGTLAAIPSFNAKAWEQVAKLGALRKDCFASGAPAMMRFVGWSVDSSRLLVGLRGGDGKFEMDAAYLYFRTATKRFELTPYLSKLNATTSDILSGFDDVLPCAEPAGLLPAASELKPRLERLDAELNEKYAAQMKVTPENQRVYLREQQRGWLQRRDAGLKLYLSLAKPREREQRRLQYLGDITAARLELPAEKWHMPETWLY